MRISLTPCPPNIYICFNQEAQIGRTLETIIQLKCILYSMCEKSSCREGHGCKIRLVCCLCLRKIKKDLKMVHQDDAIFLIEK